MVRKLMFIMPILALSTAIAAAQSPPPSQATPEVKKLLLLMDKDKNGKVSRDEFMAFFAAEFDRLDVNKDGELDVNELTGLRVSTKHPGGSGSR